MIHSSLVSTMPSKSVKAAEEGKVVPYCLDDAIGGHVVSHLDGRGIALRVGAAVAFHHKPVEAEKDRAVDLSRIHLLAQMVECGFGEKIAYAGHQRAAHGGAKILRDLARSALRGLERDVACKALGNDHVHRALAEIVALHEAVIVEVSERRVAQDLACLAHLFLPLHLLDADVEQPDGRFFEVIQRTRHGRAHHGEIDQLGSIGPDIGTDIEHHAFALQGRPQRSHGRPLDPFQRAQAEPRHRHQRAGIARRNAERRLARLHRLDRVPHARFAAAMAQGLAGLFVHADGNLAMAQLRSLLQRRVSFQKRADHGLVAEQDEAQVRLAHQRDFGPAQHHRSAVIAAHSIQRNIQGRCHRNRFCLKRQCSRAPGWSEELPDTDGTDNSRSPAVAISHTPAVRPLFLIYPAA